MNKRENRERIQDALNAALSGLQDDPWLAQRVIAEAKGEKSAKRKISYGLMLALLLVLAAVTALAAVVLSGKDFVGQYMAPLSENTNSETWSREELQYIERIARENDLPLTDDIVAELNAEDEVFKETLMRLFMNMELGDSPASWPLADQAWYDELLVRYGLAEERTRFLPMEGEIMEADAISVAIKYAQDHWGIDLSDALGYRRYYSICFLQMTKMRKFGCGISSMNSRMAILMSSAYRATEKCWRIAPTSLRLKVRKRRTKKLRWTRT